MTKVFVHGTPETTVTWGALVAELADLGDVGHWWMIEQPARAADLLINFWAIRS